MNNGNGNGKGAWIMYLVGVLVTLILIIALPAMANAIINNDRLREEQDRQIRKELADTKDAINTKLEKIGQDVAFIKARVQ